MNSDAPWPTRNGVKWTSIVVCGIIAIFFSGIAAGHGAIATGLQDGDLNALVFIFLGWLIGLLVTPALIYMMRRRNAFLIIASALTLPLLLAYSAGAWLNHYRPQPPSFLFGDMPIPQSDLARQFGEPPDPPAPGPILEGHNFGIIPDYSLIFHVRATRGSVPAYIETLRKYYTAEGWTFINHSTLMPMPSEFEPRRREGAAPLKIDWWKPHELPAPQTLELRREDEGIWIWYSPESDDIYYHFWSS